MSGIRYLLTVCMIAFYMPCMGQMVKTKDGVVLAKRSEFMSACIKGVNNKVLKINGLEIEASNYCSCVCDNLVPTINSWELEKAAKDNQMMDLFTKDKNLKVIMQCLEGNYKVSDDYTFGQTDNVELEKKIGIRTCVNAIMDDPEAKDVWTKELAEQYCNCAFEKLIAAGYTYSDIQQIKDKNSSAFNEIALPCVAEVLKVKKDFKSSNAYISSDIQGGTERCLVPLADYFGRGYKVKITMGGVSKYFLFDTGASDLLIDGDMEKELLLKGVLKKGNYLDETEYTLANNQTVKAQKVKVDRITIGDYTVNNVVIAIIKDGSLLCGKSFLDKFKKWEIDKTNNVLILYK